MIDLYEHNEEAFKKVEECLEQFGKCAVIHPTGSGKSFIAFQLAVIHRDRRFLWLSPSERIYDVQRQNLFKSVKAEQLEELRNIIDRIEFHTYHWLFWNAEKSGEMNADYIIFDEYHRCGASNWGKAIKKLLEGNPKAKCLGLSATNIRYLDQGRNMAEELFDGHIASSMTIGEAMVRKILPVPKYIISVYALHEEIDRYHDQIASKENPEIRKLCTNLLEKLKRSFDRAKGVEELFLKYAPDRRGKYLVFCPSVEQLHKMATEIRKWFENVDSDLHLYSAYCTDEEQNNNINEFINDDSGHLCFLLSINMLNEGFHVRGVDGVIMFRTTISPIIYKQQIGRALSAGKGKIPVIFDLVNNYENLHSVNSFQGEYQSAFADYRERLTSGEPVELPPEFIIYDETQETEKLFSKLHRFLNSTWEEYFLELVDFVYKHGHADVPIRYVTEKGLRLGSWLNHQKGYYRTNDSALTEDRKQRLTEIGVDWMSQYDRHFLEGVGEFTDFKNRFGAYDIPLEYVTENGFPLGSWIKTIRRQYRLNKLSEEKVKALESAGFIWNMRKEKWERNYKRAEQYFKTHGHLTLRNNDRSPETTLLRHWLQVQRDLYRKNRLPEEKIRRLESIGIIWRLNSDEYFEYYYKAACDYKDAHGNINVTTDFVTEDGVHLGDWLCRQRSYYRRNILEEWKIKKMFCLDPDWIDGTTDWEKMYRAARKIYDETGSLENSGTVDLRRWIHSQQKWVSEKHDDSAHVNNRLCLLKAIGIRGYSQKDIDFEKGFRAARKYYIRHNNLLVPKDYVLDGVRLGQWIRSQRLAARSVKAEERLSDEKIRRLTEIGMDWMTHEERKWEECFQRAKRFFDEHGTVEAGKALVLEDGFDLGRWIRKQMTWDYGELSFSMYHADKLESIGIYPEIRYQKIPKIQRTECP